MPNKGQIISFFIILVVIAGAMWQVISHGDNLKIAKELAKPDFVAQELDQPLQDGLKAQEREEPVDELSEDVGECQSDGCIDDVLLEQESAYVLIDDGSGDPKEFMLDISASTTAFDLLQEASLTAGFVIESEEYDFGVLIEAINNKKNTQDDKYWLFYVNGELSQVTPDNVMINSDDIIEFIFTNR